MPQISSQVTRQAILVDDSAFDPDHPPDRLALYGPDGTILNADTLKGADGVQGPPGIPGINWRGLYNPDADYILNDGVFYNGSSWRALFPILHPAPEPSETETLALRPFFESESFPPAPMASVIETLADSHDAIWRYLDLSIGGDVSIITEPEHQLGISLYDNTGNSISFIGWANALTVTGLSAGRYWVFLQNYSWPNSNVITWNVALANGATAAPGLPWALVAKQGDAGNDGSNGLNGIPVGGTTGQILAKNSNTDGDAAWEDAPSGGGSSGGSAWTIAQDDTQIPIPNDGSAFGPELDFVVGPSGMALLHVSFEGFNGASTARPEIHVDGTSLAVATVNIGIAQFFSLGFSEATIDFLSTGGFTVREGVMLRLAPGAHVARLYGGASNSGGQARKFRLAAMAV